MNAQVQAQFDRLEAALNVLVDSITSYNPSPAAAESLLEASDELDGGLRQLAQHQANSKRIAALRAESTALDDQIRSTLQTLADTRQELLQSTPVTLPPKDVRTVDYDELLNYAQRIAKFTVPPTYRPPLPPPIEELADSNGEVAVMEVDASLDTNAVAGAAGASDNERRPSHLQLDRGRAFAALSDATKAWLDPDSEALPFTPWPSEVVIRRGALAQIQAVRERGQDPAGMNLALQDPATKDAEREQLKLDESASSAPGGAANKEGHIQSAAPVSASARADAREAARNKMLEEFELYNPDE